VFCEDLGRKDNIILASSEVIHCLEVFQDLINQLLISSFLLADQSLLAVRVLRQRLAQKTTEMFLPELKLSRDVMDALTCLLEAVEQVAVARHAIDRVRVRVQVRDRGENAAELIVSNRCRQRVVSLYELVVLIGVYLRGDIRDVLHVVLKVSWVELNQLGQCIEEQQEERLDLPLLVGEGTHLLLVHRVRGTEESPDSVRPLRALSNDRELASLRFGL